MRVYHWIVGIYKLQSFIQHWAVEETHRINMGKSLSFSFKSAITMQLFCSRKVGLSCSLSSYYKEKKFNTLNIHGVDISLKARSHFCKINILKFRMYQSCRTMEKIEDMLILNDNENTSRRVQKAILV